MGVTILGETGHRRFDDSRPRRLAYLLILFGRSGHDLFL
jgi:hypothetical protein